MILYAAFVYQTTFDITLVTIIVLIACLVPFLPVLWNYIKIKLEEYEEQHSHPYHRG
ncbi:intracellular septation protein [Blautia sp. HA2174]|uniref:intracellular septation protein n=1 Tax=Blautia sp. HA2174 TaxID=3133036 RepID=UPI00316135DF